MAKKEKEIKNEEGSKIHFSKEELERQSKPREFKKVSGDDAIDMKGIINRASKHLKKTTPHKVHLTHLNLHCLSNIRKK